MTGVNTTRKINNNNTTTSTTDTILPLLHRAVKYTNMTLPPVVEIQADSEETPIPSIPTALLAPAAGQLLVMQKDEELGWKQNIYTQHTSNITCIDINYNKNLLVTAENNTITSESKIIIWKLNNFEIISTIVTKYGVKFIDISENGAYLLVVFTDLSATCNIYDINTKKVIFSRPLLLGPRVVKDSITDARFCGTTTMFVISSILIGITFYIDESSNTSTNTDRLRVYEERTGLYSTIGQDAVGVAVTEICRFQGVDEVVTATEKGQLLVWHGRTVSQCIQAHRTAIHALDYNHTYNTLISGSDDGVVNIYTISSHTSSNSTGKGKKSPQLVIPRLLELSASFDILRHDLCSYAIYSLALSADCRKALLTTSSNEVMEIALYITPPTAEEIAEAEAIAETEAATRAEMEAAALAAKEAAAAAAAEGGEGGEATTEPAVEEVPFISAVPSLERFLGDDLHKGAILTAHYGNSSSTTAAITSVCRMPAGGFASCGIDGTVRWWQGTGGNEETGTTVYNTTKILKMDSSCSTIDASSTTIAVALSGIKNPARDGSIHLFSVPEMQFLCEFHESKKSITMLKLSPEGNLLVAASTDGGIYVYTCTENVWVYKGICGSVNDTGDYVTKLDFSSDGLYVRCYYHSTQRYCIYDVTSSTFGRDLCDLNVVPVVTPVAVEGEEEVPPQDTPTGPPLELLRGLTWASHSCAYNWDTKGVISLQLPGTTDRFNHLLLTATEQGTVVVERVPNIKYPTQKSDLDISKLVSFTAHLGSVSSLVFIEEGARLVTAGEHDGTLRVWKVQYDLDEFEPDPVVAESVVVGEVEEEEGEEDAEGKAAKLEVIYDR